MPPIKEEENEHKLSDSCFTCGNLGTIGYYFICKTNTAFTFSSIEEPMFSCPSHNEDRKLICGRSLELWKLLTTIAAPICLASLPNNLRGAYGVLKKYGLVLDEEGSVREVSKNGDSLIWMKEKFLIPKEIEEKEIMP